jgi:flagellar biosynthesis regulator FlaF
MTKEELEKEAEKYADGIYHYKINVSDYGEEGKINYRYSDVKEAYLASAEPREKRIAELEEKISILLSCKNCPENKGGLICAKEYENKCLAQKIEFIKELQEENAELKDEWQEQVQKANDEGYARTLQTIQLTKAKEIIKKFLEFVNNDIEYDPEHPQEHTDLWNKLCEEAEQFLKDSEEK